MAVEDAVVVEVDIVEAVEDAVVAVVDVVVVEVVFAAVMVEVVCGATVVEAVFAAVVVKAVFVAELTDWRVELTVHQSSLRNHQSVAFCIGN